MTNLNNTTTFNKNNAGLDIVPFDVFNHGHIASLHANIQNASIGVVAEEVLALYPLYNDPSLARQVLTALFNANGAGTKTTFSGLDFKQEGNYKAVPLNPNVIEQKFKEIQKLNFSKMTDYQIFEVVSAIGLLKNAEGQIVIDASKKFFVLKQVFNLLKVVSLKGREAVDTRILFPEDIEMEYNDPEFLNAQNKEEFRHVNPYRLMGNGTLLTNLDASLQTDRDGERFRVADPFFQIRQNTHAIMERVSDNIVNNIYNTVAYTDRQINIVNDITKTHKAESIAIRAAKGSYGLAYSLIIASESIAKAQYNDLGEDDLEGLLTSLSDSRNRQLGYVVDFVRSVTPKLDLATRGILALDASKDGDLNQLGVTFYSSGLPEEAIASSIRLFDGANEYVGKPVVVAHVMNDENKRVPEALVDGTVVEVVNGTEIVGFKSKVAYTVEDGQWTIKKEGERFFVARNTVEVLTEKVKSNNSVVLSVQFDKALTAQEIRENGSTVDVDYANSKEEIDRIIREVVGKEVVVAASPKHGDFIHGIDENNSLSAVCQLSKVTSEAIRDYVHASKVKVEEVLMGVKGGKPVMMLMGKKVGSFPSADLPTREEALATETEVVSTGLFEKVGRLRKGVSLFDLDIDTLSDLMEEEEEEETVAQNSLFDEGEIEEEEETVAQTTSTITLTEEEEEGLSDLEAELMSDLELF